MWIQNLIIVQLLNSTNIRRIRKQNVSCVDPRNFPCVKSLNRSESNKLSLVRYTILCKQWDLRFNSCPLKILYIHVYWWFYFSNMTFFCFKFCQRQQSGVGIYIGRMRVCIFIEITYRCSEYDKNVCFLNVFLLLCTLTFVQAFRCWNWKPTQLFGKRFNLWEFFLLFSCLDLFFLANSLLIDYIF